LGVVVVDVVVLGPWWPGTIVVVVRGSTGATAGQEAVDLLVDEGDDLPGANAAVRRGRRSRRLPRRLQPVAHGPPHGPLVLGVYLALSLPPAVFIGNGCRKWGRRGAVKQERLKWFWLCVCCDSEQDIARNLKP